MLGLGDACTVALLTHNAGHIRYSTGNKLHILSTQGGATARVEDRDKKIWATTANTWRLQRCPMKTAALTRQQ